MKTGEYASIRLSGRLDTLQSAAQPVSQSAVGFFDSGGLFVLAKKLESRMTEFYFFFFAKKFYFFFLKKII